MRWFKWSCERPIPHVCWINTVPLCNISGKWHELKYAVNRILKIRMRSYEDSYLWIINMQHINLVLDNTFLMNDHSCRRFDPEGSLDWRVNCRCVPQPRWVGARWNTRRGKTAASCCPAPRVDALAVGGYKRSWGREREHVRQPVLTRGHLFRMRALDLPFIDVRRGSRCTMGV
jgi:hypothetical protein